MRFLVAFSVLCAFLFMTVGLASSDDLSDLKRQLETLKQRIEELEKKQEQQAEEVEKIPEIKQSVENIEKQPSAREVVSDTLSKGVTLGGHFKFFLADQSDGERNGIDQHNNLRAGVNDLYFYVRKSITDWLSIDLAPRVDVVAAATPTLGGDITSSNSTSVDFDLAEAFITLRAPYPQSFEVKAGVIWPLFSEEYANKTWWHEQYHGNPGLLTLQNWEAAGIEIYKNFDFDNFSMPVYFYPYLNGLDRDRSNPSRFTDNNGMKNLLLHVAPEFYAKGARFKFLGSIGWGRWDDEGDYNSLQYGAGLDFRYGGLSLSGEYLRINRDEVPLLGGGRADGDDDGFYIRGMYTFNPKWRVVARYSDVDLFFPGSTEMLTDNYEVFTFALNYWIVDGSTIIPQVQWVDSNRSDGSEELDYLRWTIGWRTTF